MGLLRACADVVLIGAGTLDGSPATRWTADDANPPTADYYAELRRRRRVPPQPTLAVLSGSGKIDPNHPGLAQPTVVLTSQQGAKNLHGILAAGVEIIAIGDGPHLDAADAVRVLRDRGHKLILCEGGPTLLGALVESNLLDELFLTVSPRLAGRSTNAPRLSLVENVELLPDRLTDARLRSVRRADSHLFLRYEIKRSDFPTERRDSL